MEQKTIGKFITALRKANGMTQKDLAEKLNVSDKTISRWERDDGAPDLSAIPVIAEIFGVTCDELLRGERKPVAERKAEQEYTAKAEKQRQRILTMSLSKYRAQSFISIGISVVGLIAAMICNLGFLRAYIGFFAGMVFYATSIVCQAIFMNGAFTSVADNDLPGPEVDRFKMSVVHLGKRSVSVTLVLLAATLPLIVFPNDTYVGLSGESWLEFGAIFGLLCAILCAVGSYFINGYLLKRKVYSLGEQETRKFWHDRRVKRNCAMILVLLFAVTFLSQRFANSRWGAWALAEEIKFYDYESFIQYMEQDIPYVGHTAAGSVPVPDTSVVYYDMYGNEITEEEALREEVRISDDSPEGKVICTYIHRNRAAVGVTPSDSGDGLPIGVITQAALDAARVKNDHINMAFIGLYGAELLVVLLGYRKNRAK